MANHTQDSPQQQLPNKKNNNTQKTNRTQQCSHKTSEKHRETKKQMDHLHILHPKNKKDHKPVQKHRHKHSVQKQQHYTTNNQYRHNQQNRKVQMQWSICNNMQNMQT